MRPTWKECVQCGAAYQTSIPHKSYWCSIQCRGTSIAEAHWRACTLCGTKFRVMPGTPRDTCSAQCFAALEPVSA